MRCVPIVEVVHRCASVRGVRAGRRAVCRIRSHCGGWKEGKYVVIIISVSVACLLCGSCSLNFPVVRDGKLDLEKVRSTPGLLGKRRKAKGGRTGGEKSKSWQDWEEEGGRGLEGKREGGVLVVRL